MPQDWNTFEPIDLAIVYGQDEDFEFYGDEYSMLGKLVVVKAIVDSYQDACLLVKPLVIAIYQTV